MAVEWLQTLKELACNAAYVLPARKRQTRMVPLVGESTLGVEPHVAERCLNHKLKGVEGVYNRHDYFEERRRISRHRWPKRIDND